MQEVAGARWRSPGMITASLRGLVTVLIAILALATAACLIYRSTNTSQNTCFPRAYSETDITLLVSSGV